MYTVYHKKIKNKMSEVHNIKLYKYSRLSHMRINKGRLDPDKREGVFCNDKLDLHYKKVFFYY